VRQRPTKEEYLLSIADLTARMSTCSRLQVGAVLTDERHEQIWVGYNGGPRGGVNACRRSGDDATGNCGCVHAEANAVVKAPGSIQKVAFLTHSPCGLCAVLLVNAHVGELHYREEYRDPEGLLILGDAGVRLVHRDGWVMPKERVRHFDPTGWPNS
jgi:dCMP deaminase